MTSATYTLAEPQSAAPPGTLFDCLREQALRSPHAFALLAPGRRPMTYAGLLAQVQHTVAQLLVFGVGRGDRVAVVVENGPEQATVVLGTACGATCAPLDPNLTSAELGLQLSRLRPRAVISMGHAAAAEAARALGVRVLTLVPTHRAPAGAFTLNGDLRPLAGPGGGCQPEDAALLLHTSGTTAVPKLVPLTHRHLLLGALNYQPVLQLSAADRSLSLLPFYHIQGFNTGLLVPLMAGASVVCTGGFSAAHFLSWLQEYQPTWYTAVPALHQAILAAAGGAAAGKAQSLRFIRSGGAALPRAVQTALEARFGVPVIEGYGMTEANPITCSPLPPRARKAGSVGPAAGPEVGIMEVGGASLLPAGTTGEVVVRGASVITGYAGNALANVESFTGGWLRTGDLGYLDEDGFLFLTGRLKELINRGGEKISPGEVEAALLAHPGVAEAAAFGIADARLGEVVGAAVVARADAAPEDEAALRQFARQRLAEFKVPRRIVFVPELPIGPNGKLQRLGLAERLDLSRPDDEAAQGGYATPEGEVEARLAEIWAGVLGRARVGRHDRFLDVGGDSLLASQVVAQASAAFGLDLSLGDFLNAATIVEQAALVHRLRPAAGAEASESGSL